MSETITIPSIELNDGTAIPQIGYGTLNVQPDREHTEANVETTAPIVTQALDAGYRHIDTAQAYGTELGVGKAVAESGIARDQLYITSKLSNANHEPADVQRSFEESLQRLGLDHMDMFLIHWPLPTLHDGDFVSTWRAVSDLIDQGILRSAGVSNFQPEHLERIISEVGKVPAVNQFEMHPYFPNNVVVEACRQHGIAVEAHSPLGHNGEPLKDTAIRSIADAVGKTVAQVILRWHVQHGHIVIPKSARPERMSENLAVFDFELSADQMTSLDALDRGPTGRVGPNPDTYEGV
jgi:2,5-diketo-D-gluconate reductase A